MLKYCNYVTLGDAFVKSLNKVGEGSADINRGILGGYDLEVC